MNFEDVNKRVQDAVEMISITRGSLLEAAPKAADFLTATAIVTEYRRFLEIEKAKLLTLQEATLSESVKKSPGKNITEKKALAHGAPEYTTVREQVEETEAGISWCKSYIRIFENAHLLYRQQGRDYV